jgi:hypothetical protein
MASTCSLDINLTARAVGGAECRPGKTTNASSDTWARISSSTATRCAESWMTSDALTAAGDRVFSSTSTT